MLVRSKLSKSLMRSSNSGGNTPCSVGFLQHFPLLAQVLQHTMCVETNNSVAF